MKPLGYLLTILSFLSPLFAISQTPEEILEIQKSTNVKKLLEYSQIFKMGAEQNRKRALEYAKVKGWPLSKTNSQGHNVELQGMTSKQEPIYFEPLDTEDIITARADKLYSGGGLGLNLHGENMTAGVWEGDPIRVNHQAFQGRVLQVDGAAFNPATMSALAYAHGTGVVGQVLAWGDGN